MNGAKRGVKTPSRGKIRFCPNSVVFQVFPALADQKIFPQGPCVGAQGERFEIRQHRVAYAVVKKVNFSIGADFTAQVSAQWRQPENNKRFFQQTDVLFNGVSVDLQKM